MAIFFLLETHYIIEDATGEDQPIASGNFSTIQGTGIKSIESRILYTGHQLWKTYIDNEKAVRILEHLREKEGENLNFGLLGNWNYNISSMFQK